MNRQSHQVTGLNATGQLGMAAPGQIRLAVVTRAALAEVPPRSIRR
jgi:hypothetical protein